MIRDDDRSLFVVPARTARAEGNGGSSTDVGFLVTRTADLDKTTTVTWSTTGAKGSPVDAADFSGGTLPGGTVVFAPGEGSRIVSVQIAADAAHEPDELVRFSVAGTIGGKTLTAAATQVILNDDAPAHPLDPRVLYIDPTTAPGGDGTINRPFQSLHGLVLVAGDMVLFRGGTVSKTFAVTGTGSPERPIVLGSYGVGKARVEGTVALSGARYVAVTNLDISPGDGYGVVLTDGTAFSAVKDCTIHGGEVGVVVRGDVGDGNEISGNLIYENDCMGVWFDGRDTSKGAVSWVSGNTIYRVKV